MISKYMEFNIICDVCGIDGCNCGADQWRSKKHWYKWDIPVPYSEKGIRDMRKTAKEYGWIHKNQKDICPKCQEEDA